MTTATIIAFAVLAFTASVNAESHTVKFQNQCGSGTPFLIQGPNTLSTGEDYTSNGPLSSAIAYLQTGPCGFNGESCTLVELNLNNPTVPGGGSSADISLISPHEFNVPTAFTYFDGCDGTGASCDSANCQDAFFTPDQTFVQVACQTDNAGLLITFCGNGTGVSSSSTASSPSSSAVTSSTEASSTSSRPSAPPSHSASTGVASSLPSSPSTTESNVASTGIASSDPSSPSTATSGVASSNVASSIVSSSSAASSTRPSRKNCPAPTSSPAGSNKRSAHQHANARHGHRSRQL